MNRERSFVAAAIVLGALGAIGATLLLAGMPAAGATPGEAAGAPPQAWGWGLLGAAIATGLSSLGAGLAVGRLGAAAIGALAEKPELFGRLLVFLGLAEGIAIYGLIVSILIINRLS